MNAPRAGRREWIGLAVIALPCLLYSMDLTVLHLAIPRLTLDLKPSSAQLLWIIDIYGFLVAGSLILSLGASPVFTLTNDIIIGSAPPERAGAASGISETCAELGGALGIAIYGSIGVALYRSMLSQALPLGLTPDVTEAAMSTLGGAVAISGQLPAQVGTALVDAARLAFLRGLVLCAAISGVGTLALATFAAATFRRLPVAAQHTGEHAAQAVA